MKNQKNQPKLRFTPYAWAKLLYLRDAGPTEVGAFGITDPDDLLLVLDVVLIQQNCTEITVVFDDIAVADHLDAMVDQGIKPEQCMRIWIHTHPGDSPAPSFTDEETFKRCFGGADWSVMFILAKRGDSYARIKFRAGPGGSMQIPVDIAFDAPFEASQTKTWQQEYERSVSILPQMMTPQSICIPQRLHAMSVEEMQQAQEDWLEDDYFWNSQEMIYDMY